MAAYSAGELKALYYLAEVTYGTTPATTQQFGMKTLSAQFAVDPKQNIDYWPDQKQYSPTACVFTNIEAGLKLKANAQLNASGYDWRQPLLEGALGATSGTSVLGNLPSYSFIVEETQGTSYGRYLLNGSKVNQLVMSVDKPGGVVLFDAEILSKYITQVTGSPPTTVSGLQSLTLGSQESAPTTAALQWKAPWTLTPASVAPFTISPESWKLTIKNNLARGPGNETGADTNPYSLTSQLHEGRQDIELEMTLFLEDLTHINYMLSNKAITSLATIIGGNTISLNSGNYTVDGSSWPELKQDVLKQTLKWRFTGVSIS